MNTTEPAALDCLIIADAQQHLTTNPSLDILILNDPTGALTTWAHTYTQSAGGKTLTRQNFYTHARATHQTYPQTHTAGITPEGSTDPATYPLHAFLTTHSYTGTLAIGHLPKSHAALADIAYDFARYQQHKGAPATLILGGNTRHMTPAFNATLANYFTEVRGLRGKGKHRCLLASCPKETLTAPKPSGPLAAFGAVFSGGKPDAGGELLAVAVLTDLAQKSADLPQPLTALDLGCGNGSVMLKVLSNLPAGVKVAQAYATDLDMDAVRSATANLSSFQQVTLSWDDAASHLPDHSMDIIMLNPPFHTGTAVDLTLVKPLLAAARRLLAPGGKLYLVHNSHARYRRSVEELFVATEQITRNKTFTVLRAEG